MGFIESIKERASQDIKTIVLPEATDLRTLKAVDIIVKEGFAKVILVGNKDEVTKIASDNNLDISKVEIIDPAISEKYETYVNAFYELRKHKGMTIEKAEELLPLPTIDSTQPSVMGIAMVRAGPTVRYQGALLELSFPGGPSIT